MYTILIHYFPIVFYRSFARPFATNTFTTIFTHTFRNASRRAAELRAARRLPPCRAALARRAFQGVRKGLRNGARKGVRKGFRKGARRVVDSTTVRVYINDPLRVTPNNGIQKSKNPKIWKFQKLPKICFCDFSSKLEKSIFKILRKIENFDFWGFRKS